MKNTLEKSKIFEIIWLLKWPVLGLLMVISYDLGWILMFLTAFMLLWFVVIEFAFNTVWLIKAIIKKNKKLSLKYCLRILAIIFFVWMFMLWGKESKERDEGSMVIGDEIIVIIENYKEKTGAYPKSYEGLPQEARDLKPVNGGNFYYYYQPEKGTYWISFESDTILVTCSRGPGHKKWICDD